MATSSSCRPSSTSAEGCPMTDPTRLHAHEMAALLRTGEVSSRELTEAHLAAAERDNRALNAWLTIDRERALAEADAADARLAAAGDPGRPGRPPAAARHPDRAQGPRLGGRRPVHRRLAHPRGLSSPVRRAHHGAPARGRRRHPRQDQHGRVRDGLVDGALGLRSDRQPVGAGPRAGRQQRRLRGGGGRLPRPARRSGPTPAARSASRRRCAASSG